MIVLQNEYLVAKIDTQGAELKSLVLKTVNQEYLWNGNPAYWGKFSPVLFPIVGSLKNDTYYFNGKAYYLPRHGFARDKEFTAERLSATEVLFTLQADEETLANYPFHFTLGLRYKLVEDKLSCTYEVMNTGKQKMYFSIGGHPAFAVPLVAGTKYSDYYLQFSHPEPLTRHKLVNGLLSGQKELLPIKAANSFTEETEDSVLELEQRLFYEDAIVLKNTGSDFVILGSDLHSHGLQFNFTGFPYLGIWAAKNAEFICIEPWCGVADNVDHNQQLEQKEGINALNPNESWKRTWSVNIF